MDNVQGSRQVWAQLIFPHNTRELRLAANRLASEMNPNQAGWARSFAALDVLLRDSRIAGIRIQDAYVVPVTKTRTRRQRS